MANLDTRSLKLKGRISALNEFAKTTKLSEDLKQKIKSHILSSYEENNFSWFDQDSLMNELPSSLRAEVSLHMHHKIVEKVYFFQDKDPGFISYMVPKLKPISLQPGDFLYKQLEYPDEVYFLTKGRVNLLTYNGLVFKTYVQGSYFGEVEILENKTRSCTVQAHLEGAEFLVLSKRHFFMLIDEFPKIGEEIKETARLRSLKNTEAKELVLKQTDSTESELKNRLTSKINNEKTTINNVKPFERMKTKRFSIKKERNRKMWQNLIKDETKATIPSNNKTT